MRAKRKKTEEDEDFGVDSHLPELELDLLPEELKMLEEAWALGNSAQKVSEDFGVDVDAVVHHFTKLERQHQTHHDRLRDIVNDLEDQCLRTKRTLEGKASALMLQSYQRLMSEYRIALAEMMSLEKPQDVVDDIMDKTFNPFVRDLLRVCTEETSRLQTEMLRLDIPVRDAKGISMDIFSRLAERLQALLPQAKLNLDTKLGVTKSEAEDRLTVSKEQSIM